MRVPERILAFLRREDNFVIAAHISPDGDAIGSALALAAALESLGKKVVLYDRDPIPRYYRFLPGSERFTADRKKTAPARSALILIDCNSPERAGLEGPAFRSTAVVDHHETEKDFGDVRWVEKGAAATGVMVFSVIGRLGVPLTTEMAENLYAAIAVDTGTFRYSNTSVSVLRIAARLVDAGVRPHVMADRLYESWDYKRFRLLTMTLNTLEITNNIAVTHISKEMFIKTGTRGEDTENFVGFPRMIDTVKISALLREVDRGVWKVSLRSKGDVNVARVAEIFGGGGHKNAAGCRITGDLKSAKALLIRACGKVCR